MSTMTRDDVEACLKKVIDPHTGMDLVSTKNVGEISVEGGTPRVEVVLGYPARSFEP